MSRLAWTSVSPRMRGALLACALALGWGCDAAWATAPDVSAVKAAYLYRLGSYVEWPASSGAADGRPFRIATMDAPEVHRHLSLTVAERRIHGRSVLLSTVDANAAVDDVQVLFVGHRPRGGSARWRTKARQPGLLVVTESPAGLPADSAINFIVEDGQVRFEAAPQVAEANGLKLSSRLLRVAARVARR